METRKTTALSNDLNHPRRQRPDQNHSENEQKQADQEAHAAPPRETRPLVWPEHYYMTAEEWMNKVRLKPKDHSTLH